MAYAQSDFGETPYQPSGVTPDPLAKKPRGCWFYGCITLIVLVVLALIVAGAAAYAAYYYYNKLIQDYTSPAAMELPPLTITEEQRKSIDDRWKAFQEAADKGEPAELVLTPDDLNALISENELLKGRLYVTIEGEEIAGKISYPLESTGLPGTKGRYLNGNATFTVSLDDGYLEGHVNSIEVNGKTPPENFSNSLRNENVLKEIKLDGDQREALRKVKSLTVKDGKIILKSRTKADADTDTDSESNKGDMPGETKAGETNPDTVPPAATPEATEAAPPSTDTPSPAPDASKETAPPAETPAAVESAPPGGAAPAVEPPKADLPKAA